MKLHKNKYHPTVQLTGSFQLYRSRVVGETLLHTSLTGAYAHRAHKSAQVPKYQRKLSYCLGFDVSVLPFYFRMFFTSGTVRYAQRDCAGSPSPNDIRARWLFSAAESRWLNPGALAQSIS